MVEVNQFQLHLQLMLDALGIAALNPAYRSDSLVFSSDCTPAYPRTPLRAHLRERTRTLGCANVCAHMHVRVARASSRMCASLRTRKSGAIVSNIHSDYGVIWHPLQAIQWRQHEGKQPMKVSMHLAILLAALMAMMGCGKPVPEGKADYVGEWQEKSMHLVITQDGSVRYKRIKGGATTSVDGPLKGFKGDNFEVGIGPMSTIFVVSKPPYQEDGKWKMVVDGVELVKTAD